MTEIRSTLADISTRRTDEDLTKLEQSEKKIEKQKKSFFQLLAVQLQNQDPTSPMDTNDMAAQIFAMNSLEQQLEGNKLLQSINDLIKAQYLAQSSASIGKAVLYEGNKLNLIDGEAELKYVLPQDANSAKLEIKDNRDKIVYTGQLESTQGDHIFRWDGTNSKGDKLPAGKYHFTIIAKGSSDEHIPVKSYVTGRIDGIFTESNASKFSIDGEEVNKEKVKVIKEVESLKSDLSKQI